MKQFIAVALAFLVIATEVQASAQAPDKVLFEGQEYSLHSYPLEKYFAENPNQKPKADAYITSHGRGYIATFEVKGNAFTLNEIKTLRRLKSKPRRVSFESVKNEMFGQSESTTLDWFTGIMVLPHGELARYFPGRWAIYSHYILLEIKNGQLTEKREYELADYELFKDRQFQAFKKIKDYKKQVIAAEPWLRDDEKLDEHIHRFVAYYSTRFLVD